MEHTPLAERSFKAIHSVTSKLAKIMSIRGNALMFLPTNFWCSMPAVLLQANIWYYRFQKFMNKLYVVS